MGMLLPENACYSDSSHARPFKCDECNKQFKSLGSLRVHQKRHRGIWAYHCAVCGQGCSSKYGLNGHMVREHNDPAYKMSCVHCGKTFSRKDHLKIHINNTHGGQGLQLIGAPASITPPAQMDETVDLE